MMTIMRVISKYHMPSLFQSHWAYRPFCPLWYFSVTVWRMQLSNIWENFLAPSLYAMCISIQHWSDILSCQLSLLHCSVILMYHFISQLSSHLLDNMYYFVWSAVCHFLHKVILIEYSLSGAHYYGHIIQTEECYSMAPITAFLCGFSVW